MKSSSKGVYVVKFDCLPKASNEVKLPHAHLNTVPNGSEEPSFLHAEDLTVIAEECVEHTAAADTNDDKFGFNDGNNYEEEDAEGGDIRKRRRSNCHSLNKCITCFLNIPLT